MTPKQAQVKVDIDRDEEPDMARIHALLQRAGYTARNVVVRRSPSGNGWHVVIDVMPRPKCPHEVIALAAILGSDPYREARQMTRARVFPRVPSWMQDKWNVLYLAHPHRSRHLHLGDK